MSKLTINDAGSDSIGTPIICWHVFAQDFRKQLSNKYLTAFLEAFLLNERKIGRLLDLILRYTVT